MASRCAVSLVVVVALGLTACGDDGSDSAGDSTTSEATAPASASAAPPDSDGAVATTSGSAGGTATVPSSAEDDAKFCPEMQAIAEFNGNQPDPDPSQPWEDYKAESMQLEESLDLYETAIASAPEKIRPQLESLRDVSVAGFEALQQSSSFEEFTAAVEGLFSEDILTATQELDAFLQQECGFGLTS